MMPLPPRWSAALPTRADAAIAVALGVVVGIGTMLAARLQPSARPLDAVAVLVLGLTAFALAWRRRAPAVVCGAVVAGVAGYLLIGYPYGPIQLCAVLAMFELGRLRGLRISATVCAVATGAMAAATLPRVLTDADTPGLLMGLWLSWLILPWSVGALVHVRSAATRRARRELVERGALRERIRVAQEVHDIAGHGFAAVAMQAGVALLVFDEDPEQARRSLEAIQSSSAAALADLRALLDPSDRSESVDREPAGLRGLPALAANLRAAGLPVELDVAVATVPAEIDRVVYRVVQESLTNVLRHAGTTTATVRVHRERDTLLVEVCDRGIGADRVRPGLGLEGMRKRVAAVGGELVTWSGEGSGFRVSASLPTDGGAG